MVDVGKRVKKARKAAGLTQIALARKIHMSQPYLANIENNVYNPSLDTLQLIANALGVDIAEFVGNGNTVKETGMTNDEIHWLMVYRSLNNTDKELAKAMMQRFNDSKSTSAIHMHGINTLTNNGIQINSIK